MPTNRLGLVIALGLLFVLPTSASADGDIFADLSFESACAKAGESNKLVVVDFWADWCGYCKQMDKETWPKEEVQEWISKNAIAIKIDFDKEASLKRRFNVQVLPTVLFVKSDQTEVARFEGYRSPSDFVEFGGLVLAGKAPLPQSEAGGNTGGSRGRGRNAPASQTTVAKIPMMGGLSSEKGYWRWIAMFALAAVVCVSCFKNPKRSHNN